MLKKMAVQATWQRWLLPEIANEDPWPLFHPDTFTQHKSAQPESAQRHHALRSINSRTANEEVTKGALVKRNREGRLVFSVRALRRACERLRRRDFFIPVPEPSWTKTWLRREMVLAGWRAWPHQDDRLLKEEIEVIVERWAGKKVNGA